MSPDDHDDCHLNTSFNRLLIGAHGLNQMICDHAGTAFSGKTDFTNSTVTGVGPTVTVYNVGTGSDDIQIPVLYPGATTTTVESNMQAIVVDYGGGRRQVTLQGDINNSNPTTYTDGNGNTVANPHYNHLLYLPFALRPNHSHEFVISQDNPGSGNGSLGGILLDGDGRIIRMDSLFTAPDGEVSQPTATDTDADGQLDTFTPGGPTISAPARYRRVEGLVYWILTS